MTETELDRAHAAMAADEEGAARLAFYHALADAQLYLLLSEEAQGADISPQTYDLEGAPHALAFDTEDRLAEFTGAIAPYAALPGRTLAGMLAEAGAGLALNLGVASSAILLPHEALAWLAGTLGQGGGTESGARPEALTPPREVPEALLRALDAKLARASGLASHACLTGARYAGGEAGYLLVVVGAAEGAETALTRAVSEALTFSGVEAGALDVGFAPAGSALAERAARVGLRFDLPHLEAPEAPAAPGSDSEKPPKLK